MNAAVAMVRRQGPMLSDDRMRVAQVIDRVGRPGGAQALLLTLAKVMQDGAIDLTVLTTRENDPVMSSEIAACGARVVAFPGSKLIDPVRLMKLIRFVRKEDFDVIHTHLSGATILGAITGALCNIPVVTTLHSTDMPSLSHTYHGRLESWLQRHAVSRVIAVGNQTVEAHRRRLGDRAVTVIPNAVPTLAALSEEQRRLTRLDLTGQIDGCILICAGRLIELKGLLDLLEAFAILRRTANDVFLAIVGDGPMAEALKARTRELGLADSVHFTGLRHDVPQLLAASDVYVSAAHWEGLPIAMLEAMSVSLAVVGTAVGDVPVALGGGAGILVPPRAPAELAKALAPVVADVELRHTLGAAAKARVETAYGADAWARKLCRVYEQVTAKRRLTRRAPRPV